MKSKHPLGTERRRLRRLAFLGTSNPSCAICGESSPECLEVHEIPGFKRDPEATTIRCRNCHRKLHERLLSAGITMERERCPVERTAEAMRALSVTLREEAEALERWASVLNQIQGRNKHENKTCK